MSREADADFPQVVRVFAPPMYTDHDLRFIKKHIGTRGSVALAKDDEGFEGEERPAEVEIALNRFAELEELEELGGLEGYGGLGGVSDAIDTWLERQRRYLQRKRQQGVSHHPELYDTSGDWQGPGSDADRPRRYDVALYQGSAVTLEDFTKDLGGCNPDAKEKQHDLLLIEGTTYFDCPVPGCNHRENWEQANDKNQRRMARTRIAGHFKRAKREPEQHQLVYKANFK